MKRYILLLLSSFFLASCTYNPLSNSNDLTGSAAGAAVGASVGAGSTALLNAPGPIVYAAGLGGAAIGYYATTLRFDSSAIVYAGGQVFALGDYITIEIPTDNLFDSNTADFLPNTQSILDSVASVLGRYPNNNIIISGNTSGFSSEKYETQLSEDRARQVASYLWTHGFNSPTMEDDGIKIKQRKLIYVGYGNYFPVANNITAHGVRQNSRIQIVSFPHYSSIHLTKACRIFNNIGAHHPCALQSKEPCEAEQDVKGENVNEEQAPVNNYAQENPTDLKGENFKGEESFTDYKNTESSPQTNEDSNVAKHGGFKGEF